MITQKKLLRLTQTIVVFQMFLLLMEPFAAHAIFGSSRSGTIRRAFDMAEQRYNFNREDVQRDLTDRLGSTEDKIIPPSVRVTFLPANPKPGQKVTARAEALNFASKSGDMYYTWMLRNGDAGSAEQAKLNAIRALYENYTPGEVGSRSRPPENIGLAFDDDGYTAILGGQGNVQRENFCYLYDYKSGEAYELNELEDEIEDPFVCPAGAKPICAEKDVVNCPLSISPTAGEATGGEGGEGGEDADNSTGGAGGSVEICGPEGPREVQIGICDIADRPTCTPQKEVLCEGGSQPYCVTGAVTSDKSTTQEGFFCPAPDVLAELYNLPALCEEGLPDEPPIDLACAAFVETGVLVPLTECEAITEDEVENLNPCKGISEPRDKDSIHLFYKNDSDLTLGDGTHPDLDEAFLGSSPFDPRTNVPFPGSQNDEALAVGLGVTELTWTYQAGDKINVVVEGVGATTLHNDSSRQIVWGFLNDSCSAAYFTEKGRNTSSYITDNSKTIKTLNVGRDDINECLGEPDHFISPGEERTPGSLDIELSFSPQNPSAGGAAAAQRGRVGDVVTLSASTTNSSKDSSQQYYTWCAEVVGDIDTGRDGENFGRADQNKGCGDYDNVLTQVDAVDLIGKDEGLGAAQTSFRLKDIDGNYLRVRAEVNENFTKGTDDGLTQDGATVVYIPLNTSDAYIGAYQGSAGGGLSVGTELCGTGGLDAAACRVVENEIIALRIESSDASDTPDDGVGDFTWQIDGGRECQSDCGDDSQLVKYITPTGSVGDTVHIVANGTNVKTGENITVSRSLRIVEPFIQVVSIGGATAKTLGAYRDLEGNEYDDESKIAFEAAPGSDVSFEAVCHPSWACNNTSLSWNVNGRNVVGDSITTTVDGAANVQVQGVYAPSPETRKLLDEHFNISQFSSTEKLLTHSARVTTSGVATAQNGPERFLATIATNTPAYFLFLLRITLTTLLILFIAGLAMNLGGGVRRN